MSVAVAHKVSPGAHLVLREAGREAFLRGTALSGRYSEVLVIGARRRTPVGKFILGSSTQNIILEAEIPVLVVKSD